MTTPHAPHPSVEQSLGSQGHLQPSRLGWFWGCGLSWPTAGPCRHLLLAGQSGQDRHGRVHIAAILHGAHLGLVLLQELVRRGGPGEGRVVAWTWQCYTSASILWPSKSWSVQIQGWGIVFVLPQRGVGRGEGGRIEVVLTISPEAACCQGKNQVTLLLLLAVQIWAGAKPLVSASSSAEGD